MVRRAVQVATLDAELRAHVLFFFFSSRRRHTRFDCDWSSDVCSSDLPRLRHREPQLHLPGAGRDRPLPRRWDGGDQARGEPPGDRPAARPDLRAGAGTRSEEHTSELQSQSNLVCRLLLEKKNKNKETYIYDHLIPIQAHTQCITKQLTNSIHSSRHNTQIKQLQSHAI